MLKQAKRAAGTRSGLRQFRVLGTGTLLTILAGYVAVVVVLAVVAALSAASSPFSPLGVALSAGPGWLAAYQVPVAFNGASLGVEPLLLTVGVFALVAGASRRIASRAGFDRPLDALAVVGSMALVHAAFGVAVSIMAGSTTVTADPLAAFLVPGLIGGLAATAGVAGRCGLLRAIEDRTDVVGAWGIRCGVIAAVGLVTVGAAVFAAASAWQAPAMARLFAVDVHGVGNGFGLLLACVGYVPNAVVGGLSFASGAGVSVGPVSAGPFGYSGGDVPAVPLFAGVPEAYSPWWPVVLVLPVLVGAAVGWRLRAVSERPWQRVRAVVIAGAIVGLALVLLGAAAGGRLGSTGSFDVHAGAGSLAGFCWVVVPGSLVAVLAGRRSSGDASDDGSAADDADAGGSASWPDKDADEAADGDEAKADEAAESSEEDAADDAHEEPEDAADEQAEPEDDGETQAEEPAEPEGSTKDESAEKPLPEKEKAAGK